MKILQIGTNIGSQLSICVQALRLIGEQARGIVAKELASVNYSDDCLEILPPEIDQRGLGWAARKAYRYSKVMSAIAWADVIHWHFNDVFLRKNFDLQWARRLGKPGLVEFWGTDIRVADIEASDNAYFAQCAPESYRNELTRERSRTVQEFFAEAGFECMTSCRSVLPHIDVNLFPRVHIVRQRLLLADYEPHYPDPANKRPIVVHSPSNPALKGSVQIQQAIDTLKARYNVEYVQNHQVPHSEALRCVRGADIFVDQIVLGSYGIAAIEAMALGKPTVCYIKPSMVNEFPPDLPIVNANIDNIRDVLENLVRDGRLRAELGRRGRAYVEKHHDAIQIAGELKGIYQSLLQRGNSRRSRTG